MKYISIDNVEPGHVLAKCIYASDGRILLNTGVPLTVGMINQLRRVGIISLYIESKFTDNIRFEDVVSDETRREAIINLSSAIQAVQGGKDVNIKEINTTVNSVIDEVLKNKHVLVHLSDVRTKDNQLFVHSQNVCMMSTLIGIKLGYNYNALKDLAIGALLHDIGKVAPENSSIVEPKKRAAGENYNHHAWKGFNILRKKHEISVIAAHVPLQHHEYVNGTGEPRGIDGSEINPLAKIVAVTNYYDNLISNINNDMPLLPHEACEYIMAMANIEFDLNVVVKFLESVAIYPTGSSVRLNTGDVGIVVDQHNGLPARPVVRVIKQEKEDEDHEIFEIDLAKATTVFIEHVFI